MMFATQQHMRFLHFGITRTYMDSLEADNVEVKKENCLVVTCTKSLDLGVRSHRLYLLHNVSAIVNFALDSEA